jgi:hypothetical protein
MTSSLFPTYPWHHHCSLHIHDIIIVPYITMTSSLFPISSWDHHCSLHNLDIIIVPYISMTSSLFPTYPWHHHCSLHNLDTLLFTIKSCLNWTNCHNLINSYLTLNDIYFYLGYIPKCSFIVCLQLFPEKISSWKESHWL